MDLAVDLPAVEAALHAYTTAALHEMAAPTVALTVENGRLWLTSGYNAGALDHLKAIPGRVFDPPSKRWHFPLAQFQTVYATVKQLYPAAVLPLLPLARAAATALAAVHSNPGVKSVHITPDGKNYRLESPYHATFVAQFKATVPPGHRKWLQGPLCWWFTAPHLAAVRALAVATFGADQVDAPPA